MDRAVQKIGVQSSSIQKGFAKQSSTTSLDPPGAELGNLIGGDEPEYDVLEQPEQDLAMDRWEG